MWLMKQQLTRSVYTWGNVFRSEFLKNLALRLAGSPKDASSEGMGGLRRAALTKTYLGLMPSLIAFHAGEMGNATWRD